MLELRDGTRKIDKHQLFTRTCTKPNTRWLVHSWNTFCAKTNHGQLKLTRLTTVRTWGKPPPSPLQYTLRLSTRPTSKILTIGTPTTWTSATLGAYNFACRPVIEMSSKAKLQLQLRAFQRYVTCHLHIRKWGRFLTFSGRESNYQFDSRPFFWP